MAVLDGVKVVELAEFGFVPSCGAVLADWGADVVKVERITGDPLRHVQGAGLVADTGDFNFLWEQMNRNKRGIALDLRSPDGRAALDRLLEQADVVITNFLPSARASLRLDPDDVWAVNPRLVYAKGHGQGQRGPEADQGGFDSVSYWARGGLGHVLTPTDGPLVMPRAAMGDGPSGAFLAGGVAAALYQREKTGRGSVVDVALLGTAVWTLAPDLVATTILRTDPEPLGGGMVLSSPLIGPYRTGDGRWLLLNMMDDVRHWAPTCRALGLDHLLADDRFADTAGRAEARVELHDAFAATIDGREYADLRAALAAEDTIFSVMAAPTEVIEDPQVVANGYLAPHPDHERACLASAPCQFDDEPLVVRRGAPDIGEHTDAVLAEAGLHADEIRHLHETGAIACERGTSTNRTDAAPAERGPSGPHRRHESGDDVSELQQRARTLRNVTEPIAAGVYFAPEAHRGYEAQGLDYFEGYFCSRSACLGAAPWSVVCATFAAFKPAAVEAAVTSGWAKTTPAPMLAAREAGATAQLERLVGASVEPAAVERATEILSAASDGVDPSGRALFAGLSILDRPTTAFGALSRAADLVREHRGDGHIAAWMPHVDSTEITVMTELAWGIPPRSYVFTRGWNEEEVDAAYTRLTDRGLLVDGALTDAGTELRSHIERTTDESTSAVIDRIGDDFDELVALLTPMAEAIVTGGGYPTSPKNLRVSG